MTSDAIEIARRWYANLETAWNEGDGAAFGAEFVDPCDFVDVRGAHHSGASTIAAGHNGIFASIYRDSTMRYTVEDARFLDTETILAHGRGELDAPHAPPPIAGGASARSSVVLLRDGDQWRATAMQNTLEMSIPGNG